MISLSTTELEDLLADVAALVPGRFLPFAMSPAAQAVAKLRRIRDAAAAGRPADGDDAAWLAAVLTEYLDTAQRGGTLDAAAGVAPQAFVAPWWAAEAVDDRDALIGELSEVLAGPSVSRTAKNIEVAARRYARDRWPAVADLPMPPDHAAGAEALLWRLHRSGARWPLAWRSILDILQRSRVGLQTDQRQHRGDQPGGPQ